MSIDKNFHVGPYIRIQLTKETFSRSYKACANTSCENFGNARFSDNKFCHICGGPIKENKFPEERFISYDEFVKCFDLHRDYFRDIYHDNEHLVKKNELLLIENGRSKDIPHMLRPENSFEEIKPDTVPEELLWFIKKHTKHILSFEQKFGEDKVKIGYAAFVFCS